MVMTGWTMEHLLGGRKRFRKDSGAQVSFAVIAVAILVASSMAGAYLAKQEMNEADAKKRQKLLEAMESEVLDVARELELSGASRAQRLVSGWESFPVNETEISVAFSIQMSEYINSSYPRIEDRFSLEVTNWTGGLFYIEQKTMDLVPADSARQTELEVDGAKMTYDKLPSPSTETLAERTVNPYYVALGNFTVTVSKKDIQLSRQTCFQRPVISALPFLESKLRSFEAAADGEFSDLGRLVSYMLSSLCELRVLEGYGQPMYSGGFNTSMILTEEDVYRAMAVGLLLEQARLFKGVDKRFAQQVAEACGGSYGLSALLSSTGGYVDPAELFLWFLGKTTVKVDSKMVIAQAVFGLADQLVLKLMDYMGWLGVADGASSVLNKLGGTLDSAIAWLTGEDKALSSVTSWISDAVDVAGMDIATAGRAFEAPQDFSVIVPGREYFVKDASGQLYPVWVGNFTAIVDAPGYDLLSSAKWKDFYPSFKDCQASLRDLLEDAVIRLGFDIASMSELLIDGTAIDPSDNRTLFESLARGAGSVKLLLDKGSLQDAGRNLPMFSAQYELASRFSSFIRANAPALVDLEDTFESACGDVASSILASARYAFIPELAVPVEDQLREIVRTDVASDLAWGLGGAVRHTLDAIARARLLMLASAVNSSVAKADDGFAGPLVDSVAGVIAFGAEGIPGVDRMIEDCLTGFSRGVLRQGDLSGFKRSVYVDLLHPFEFWDGDRSRAESQGRTTTESISVQVPGGLAPMRAVPYDAKLGYTSLSSLFPVDDFLVQIKRPWDFERGCSEYPNLHLTSLANSSATPYTTQWTASVAGLVDLSVATGMSGLQSVFTDEAPLSHSQVKIDITVPVVLHSAWPLQGVEYNPSSTFVGDALEVAKKFCEVVWDKIEPAVGWLKDGLERAFRFVTHAFETLASFANRVIKALASALQVLVETMQEFVQKIANSVLAKAVRWFIDLTGRVEFKISLFGFLIIVQTNLPDLIYRQGSDLLRIIVSTGRLGPGISFGIRVAKLSDGSYDILANGTLSMKHVRVDVMVDPLMHIMRRLVEVHCTGKSWGMDLLIPEVEPYETAQVSTADLPGAGALLSNIPIPVLGLSASVEAGLKVKYSSPFPKDVVVNEFESNPPGEDSGREWVELYNPLAEPRCLDGWSLTTAHGKISSLALHGTVPRNGLLVFEFPETAIDNGYPGDPFNDGDAILLLDPEGRTVDMTPMLRDTANDGRTNQRSWDGGPKWVFREGGRGASNGAPVMLASSDFIAKALFEAFKEAFTETQLQEVSASLEFVTLFAKRVLNNFIENMLALMGEIIHEVIFFIKVCVNDATGSAGLGFRASFIVTGGAVVDLLRWLIHSFATFVVNLGRPSCPIAYPSFPQGLFSGLFLRFELLFEVGLPKMIRVLGASGSTDGRFICAVAISPNLPAVGKLAGRHWGNWSVEFGVYLEGVPKSFAASFVKDSSGDLMDFWLVKGRLYGL